MSDVRQTSAMQVIATTLADGNCATLLDVGCGSGVLKPHIEKLGVRWTGVDPDVTDEAPKISAAGAEDLPFASGQFDSVLFLNSLHHVPVEQMSQALRESLRVLAPGRGPVIVIEPAVEGDLSELLRHVDDETSVRRAAQSALSLVIQQGLARASDAYDYIRNERYDGFNDFATRLAQADSWRTKALTQNRELLLKDFNRLATHTERGFILRQPMKVTILMLP